MDINKFLGLLIIVGSIINIVITFRGKSTRDGVVTRYIDTKNIIGSIFMIIGGLVLLLGKAKLFK